MGFKTKREAKQFARDANFDKAGWKQSIIKNYNSCHLKVHDFGIKWVRTGFGKMIYRGDNYIVFLNGKTHAAAIDTNPKIAIARAIKYILDEAKYYNKLLSSFNKR